MAGFLEYDAKRHTAEGDAYVEWLKSWNVDVDNMPELKEQTSKGSTESDDATGDDSVDDDYDKWTNEELREELNKRELPQNGNKAELIARLREDDAEDDES